MTDHPLPQRPPTHGHTTARTRFHEAGPDGRIGLVPLANYLQQAAGDHADALGLGAKRLLEDDLFWVLTRQYVEVSRWPTGGSEIAVETWPSDRPRQLFRRDFIVRDAADEVLARATSTWALIDGGSRRAVKAPPWIASSIAFDTSRAVGFPTRQTAAMTEPDHERRIAVRWMDLDQNGHVNNASLAGFVLEALPADYLASHRLCAIDLVFRAECDAIGEIRTAAAGRGAGRFAHTVDRDDGTTAVRAVTEWRSNAGGSPDPGTDGGSIVRLPGS